MARPSVVGDCSVQAIIARVTTHECGPVDWLEAAPIGQRASVAMSTSIRTEHISRKAGKNTFALALLEWLAKCGYNASRRGPRDTERP